MDESDYVNEKNEPKFNSFMSKEIFNETNFSHDRPMAKQRLRSENTKMAICCPQRPQFFCTKEAVVARKNKQK